MDLMQFKDTITEQERHFREILKSICDFNKEKFTEEELGKIKTALINIASPKSMDERKVCSGFLSSMEEKDNYAYVLHTFEMILSVVIKSWIKIEDIIVKPISEYTEEESREIMSKVNVMLLDKLNSDDEFLINKIDDIRVIIVELVARAGDAGKKLSVNERYSPIFDTINTNLIDFGINVMSMTFMVARQLVESMKGYTENIPEYVKHIIIVDNVFSNISVLDLGVDTGVEEDGNE